MAWLTITISVIIFLVLLIFFPKVIIGILSYVIAKIWDVVKYLLKRMIDILIGVLIVLFLVFLLLFILPKWLFGF